MDKEENKIFSFELGDIVIEGELIATLEKSPMIGIVMKVEKDYFSLSDDYIIGATLVRRIQDRITIQWLTDPYVETLPEELIELVSRNSLKES